MSNILRDPMVYPLFLDLPLVPTRCAMTELYNENLDLNAVLDVLERGYDCPRSRRSKEIIERCLDRGRKTIRVVVAKSFNFSLDTEVWAESMLE